ncbi:MAG: redox-sensing transcriptional repressor Rex [Tissierellia bacterium]|nr:redox-sensing transcriptional repressor Rex [Tissierellia bacterium]
MAKKVSITVIRRLPKYHRYLNELEAKGIDRVSSQDLSVLTGFTASQIRQDFNNFGGFGQQGYGYNVRDLKMNIEKIMGYNNPKKTVMVGVGKLGQAIARYQRFDDAGMELVGLFDRNKNNIGKVIQGIEVQSMDNFEKFLQENDIQIGIITASGDSAQELTDKFVNSGIKGIWNFATVDLNVPDDVYVEDVRLMDSLLTLSYFVVKGQNENK